MVRVEINQSQSVDNATNEKNIRISEVTQYSSDEDEPVLDEDDFDINESLTDRLLALKDAVPPQYRELVLQSARSANQNIKSLFSVGGKGLWALTSSSILIGIPLSLCILSEQQLAEMAKGLGGDASDVLTGSA